MTGWQTLSDERGVWTYEYEYDEQGSSANSLAIRLRDGEIAVISPPSGVPDEALDELAAHGNVVALIAPNGYHYLGQPRWQSRFRRAKVFAPKAAAKRILKKAGDLKEPAPISEIAPLLPDDVWIGQPPYMKTGDVVARVETEHGPLWYFNDLVMNMTELPRGLVLRTLFKLTDSGPGFSVARLVVKLFVQDKPAFKQWLLAQLAERPPTIVVTGHGPTVTDATMAARLPKMVDDAI